MGNKTHNFGVLKVELEHGTAEIPILPTNRLPTLVQKTWGTERWLVNDPESGYCVKEMTLLPGFQCSLHYHREKDETFYVLRGTVMLLVEGVMHRLEEGDWFRIRPMVPHRFHCTGGVPATFIECSTFHDDEDVVRLEDSRPIV